MLISVLVFLIVICVFDPAGGILNIKYQLFCIAMLFFLIQAGFRNTKYRPSLTGLIYITMFISIPLISIAYYYFINDSQPFDGFLYFKSYLFIVLSLVLSASGIDLSRRFSIVLTAMSITTILIYVVIIVYPITIPIISNYGLAHGTFAMSWKKYGPLAYYALFFRTSPMIVIAICFYYNEYFKNGKKINILLILINSTGLLLSGTRANIFVAIAITFFEIFKYSRKKAIILLVSSCMLLGILIANIESLTAMLSIREESNSIKTGYLLDYFRIFEDWPTLLLGQGVGAYNFWSDLGVSTSQTELTFLEIFRNYGLILGIPFLLLLLYPFMYCKIFEKQYILDGYFFYLMISFTNPFLISSSGMLVLSIILSNTVFYRRRAKIARDTRLFFIP